MAEETLAYIRVDEARRQRARVEQTQRDLGPGVRKERRHKVQRVPIIAALLIGVLMGVVGSWGVQLAGGARVQVVEGYAWANEEGTAIGLSPDGDVPGTGYTIAGAMWREQLGPWHDTSPSCLEPLVAGQRVRLGVLDAGAIRDAPHRAVVVWLECLD